MRLIFFVEWRRLVRERTSLWVLALLLLALGAAALTSAMDARGWRAQTDQVAGEWFAARARAAEAAHTEAARTPRSEDRAVMGAFQFARGEAPPAVLPALGGLALGTGGFELLAPTLRATVESRHTDSRKSERFENPLFGESGTPDLSTCIALLLPLALLGLCGGLVQQAREDGTWRLVVAQCPRPGRVFAVALGLRALAAWSVAALVSSLAFAIDPGATAGALAGWLVTLAAFVAAWTVLMGFFCLLRVSSSAAVLGALAVWLLSSFAVPVSLAWAADGEVRTPSRLEAIVHVRHAQQHAETHMDVLVQDWYAAHPQHRPATRTSHTWPVTYMPRYLAQDREIRPLMTAFDEARARRYAFVERWSWLSPGLALEMTADRLAGIDAIRYARHVHAVNLHEDAWREFFVPRIMSYHGMTALDYADVPVFDADTPASPGTWRHAAALAALALAGLALLMCWRSRLPMP